MSTNLHAVSRQWASRPDDQRFLTLDELRTAVAARRHSAREIDTALNLVSVIPSDDGNTLMLTDGDMEAPLTHWSFGQLAQRVRLPSAALREMPPELAAMNMQWGLEHRLEDDAEGKGTKLLVGPHDGAPLVVRAATSLKYGRIWDLDVVDAVRRHIGPEWKIPGASYASHDPRRATTLYASDRDVFLFLCNEENPIEVPGTGGREKLHRGFYVSNSETGAATFTLCTFLYRYICDNRIVWGADQVQELRIRHNGQAPGRFLGQAGPRLRGYLNASTAGTVDVVRRAMAKEVGKDKAEVISFLRGRGFGAAVAASAYASAERDGLNPRSLWGTVQGLTSEAHSIKHTDSRVQRERDAGDLLDLVAK